MASTFTQVLSDDGIYEYRADRWWAEGPRLVFVGCNPSLITWRADARLDPTSANCEAVNRRDGYAGVTMLNLWALRSTDPRELRGHPDPVGPGWAEAFDEAVREVCVVVVAWGTAPFGAGTQLARRRIADVIDRLVTLGLDVRCAAIRRTANRATCRCGVCRGAPCRHCNRLFTARPACRRAAATFGTAPIGFHRFHPDIAEQQQIGAPGLSAAQRKSVVPPADTDLHDVVHHCRRIVVPKKSVPVKPHRRSTPRDPAWKGPGEKPGPKPVRVKPHRRSRPS